MNGNGVEIRPWSWQFVGWCGGLAYSDMAKFGDGSCAIGEAKRVEIFWRGVLHISTYPRRAVIM